MSYHRAHQSVEIYPHHQIKRYIEGIGEKIQTNKQIISNKQQVTIINKSQSNMNVNITIQDKYHSNYFKRDQIPTTQESTEIFKQHQTYMSMDETNKSSVIASSRKKNSIKNYQFSAKPTRQSYFNSLNSGSQQNQNKNLSTSQIANEFQVSKSSIRSERSFQPINNIYKNQSPLLNISSIEGSRVEEPLENLHFESSQSSQSESENSQFPSHFYSKEIRNSIGRQKLKQQEKVDQHQSPNQSYIIIEEQSREKHFNKNPIKIQQNQSEGETKNVSTEVKNHHQLKMTEKKQINQSNFHENDLKLQTQSFSQKIFLGNDSIKIFAESEKQETNSRPKKLFQNIEIIEMKKQSFDQFKSVESNQIESFPSRKTSKTYQQKWSVDKIESKSKDFITLTESKQKTYTEIMKQKHQYEKQVEESNCKQRAYDLLRYQRQLSKKKPEYLIPNKKKRSIAENLFEEHKRKYLNQLRTQEKSSNKRKNQLYHSFIEQNKIFIKKNQSPAARSKSKTSNRSISPKALQITQRLYSDKSKETLPCKYYRKWNDIAERDMFFQIVKQNMFVQKYLSGLQIEDVFQRLQQNNIEFSMWSTQIVNEAYKKMSKISKRQNLMRIHYQ